MRHFPLTRVVSRSVIASLLILASQPASAFADDEARKAILELRQQVRNMTNASLQLNERIDQLQQEVTRLRGEIEQIGRGKPGSGTAASGSANNPDGVTKVEDAKEQSSFDGSMELFRKGQYKEANEALTAFLTLYPESPLAPTAMFYLGSSKYALKDYKGSVSTLSAMVQKSPTHPRSADALLVIAGGQIELNNRAGAKTTLQRILKEYKGTPAAETAAKRLQLLQ